MGVGIGDRVPDVEVRTMQDDRPAPVRTGEVLGQGRVVLFAVPGAFTPGCSRVHLPGYVERAAELKAKGVDLIACVAVNDAFVMDAWAKASGAEEILMLADGNGDFARAMGLDYDASSGGMGLRSRRYAALIEDGAIRELEVEPKPGVDVSSAEAMLGKL